MIIVISFSNLSFKDVFARIESMGGFGTRPYMLRIIDLSPISPFNMRDCEDFYDYIYKTDDLAHLKGNKYSKKRNLIHQFLKSHVDQGRVDVHPLTVSDISECLEFLDTWSDFKVTDPRLTRYGTMERTAAETAIRNIETIWNSTAAWF